ncbi:amino acid adenylation domain protein [Mycobacterium kansasii]|nr:amino acid adenylation domain protein [Mycobacterium kansasii]
MAEFESAVGMFANTVLLPVDLAPDAQLRAQLQRQAVATQEVLNRQDVTLADVLTDTPVPAGVSPLEFLFVLESTDYGALALPDCGVRHLWPQPAQAKCPLTLFVLEREAGPTASGSTPRARSTATGSKRPPSCFIARWTCSSATARAR